MATPIRMPDVGTVEGDVVLSRWLKKEGQEVRVGEPLLEVETDKGVNEIESVADGVLLRRIAVEGAKVPAGELIAWIGTAGEVVPAEAGPAGRPAETRAVEVPPALRQLAAKRGVDLASIRGTGPGGTVTRADILAAAPTAAGPAPAPAASAAAAAGRTRLSGIQAAVARTVSKSWAEIPAYHVSMQADMSRAKAFRAASGVSWDALFVRAVGMALAEMPLFRSHMEGSEVVQQADSAVAVAVAVGDDLYAPVVREAGAKPVQAVSREIESLAAKARARSLAPAEMEGGCILVSNLGMLPVESFDAIVYPGHSAALAVGAALPTPVAAGEAVRVVPLARLTLSADHRLINGKTAAQFLARVKDILEAGTFA
jgi:pyruvate dehydrogenase E2 component (dihydrolipoamide acetyltransferase)